MNHLTFEYCETLFQNKQFEEAFSVTKKLTDAFPNHANAWHLLALLFFQFEKVEQAISSIKKAILLEDNPVFQLNHANMLKQQKRYAEAECELRALILVYPAYAAAHNNLGVLLLSTQRPVEAVEAFQAALKHQHYFPDVYYNLGLAYSRLNQIKNAIHSFQSVLALNDAHAGARFQLSLHFMKMQDHQAALNELMKLNESHPFHFETKVNLATSALKSGELDQAKKFYQEALSLSNHDEQVLFNLGVISNQQNLIQDAKIYFSRVVELNDLHFDAHNNLAVLFLMMNHRDLATKHFQKALQIQPHNISIAHTVKILMQDKTVTATPLEYVENLFDSYASHYDAHLNKILKYQFPSMLKETLEKLYFSHAELNILDLGCGTGLCAAALKPFSKKLFGIDISSNMLNEAKLKNQYDALIHSDLISYLKNQTEKCHLLVAGDVLNYFGDLNEFMSAASFALLPHGRLIFNIELSDSSGFHLTQSGRFLHHMQYIHEISQKHKLFVVSETPFVVRHQAHQPVKSLFIVLETELSPS